MRGEAAMANILSFKSIWHWLYLEKHLGRRYCYFISPGPVSITACFKLPSMCIDRSVRRRLRDKEGLKFRILAFTTSLSWLRKGGAAFAKWSRQQHAVPVAFFRNLQGPQPCCSAICCREVGMWLCDILQRGTRGVRKYL